MIGNNIVAELYDSVFVKSKNGRKEGVRKVIDTSTLFKCLFQQNWFQNCVKLLAYIF